tara:strand:+ start:1470 stop:1649 length:180 start_codon:yes stop_codon:yes gene_type:complete
VQELQPSALLAAAVNRCQSARERLQQRRLARGYRPNDQQPHAWPQLKLYTIERRLGAKA